MTWFGFPGLRLAVGGGLLVGGILPGPAPAQERQSFRHVSVEQGLSHGAVRDIMQDRQGFIWIATEVGLNRYDGVNLKVFRHEHGNPNSLSSSNFGKLI
ncbi:MAG: two-component regulator propeller domain-containing protein, partial [Gemmatimonadales bacterium]